MEKYNQELEREKLYGELQKRLDWYVFKENDDRLDAEEIRHIVSLMDKLHKPNPAEAFDAEKNWKEIEKRFERGKGNHTSLDGEVKITEKIKGRRKLRGGQLAGIAAAVVCLLVVGANIGTLATSQKGIISIIAEKMNGIEYEITVPKEKLVLRNDKMVYYSWTEIPEEYREKIFFPNYIPKGMELYTISIDLVEKSEVITIRYVGEKTEKYIGVDIQIYKEDNYLNYKNFIDDKYKKIEDKKIGNREVSIYENSDNEIYCRFIEDDKLCYIYSNIENIELEKFIINLQ